MVSLYTSLLTFSSPVGSLRRKAHYNEFHAVKLAKELLAQEEEEEEEEDEDRQVKIFRKKASEKKDGPGPVMVSDTLCPAVHILGT